MRKRSSFLRPSRGAMGNALWNVQGHRYYWNGPGSRLYLLYGKDEMTTIDHPAADGNYRTVGEAQKALRRFVSAPARGAF